jgi:hypothetical protein
VHRDYGVGSHADSQHLGIDAVQQAEQLPVAGTRALLAALPLRDHVGVHTHPLPAAQPGKARDLIRNLLLRPAALLA